MAATFPLEIDGVSVCSCPDTRSVLEIVWLCISTMFLCTWVSVHLNLPPPGEYWITRVFRRFKVVLYALLGPEMIVIWAARQWSGARKISKRYKDHGWTLSHGFLLIMGGFVLVKGEEDLGTISPDLFRTLYDAGDIHFPSVTEEEIQDKSKGDFISKGLVVMQTSWFIIQCIARSAQGLGITEIEILALAFCSLNAMTFYFWWHKPLDVQLRSPVYLKAGSEFVHLVRVQRTEEIAHVGRAMQLVADALEVEKVDPMLGESSDRTKRWLQWISFLLFDPIKRTFKRNTAAIRITIVDDLHNHSVFALVLIRWPLKVIIYCTVKTCVGLFAAFSMIIESDAAYPGANRVPTFYSPPMEGKELGYSLMSFAFVGSAFGALHCIPWNFQFPTHTELVLWRSLSLFIACVPMTFIFCWTGTIIPATLLKNEGETWIQCLQRLLFHVNGLVKQTPLTSPEHRNFKDKIHYGFKVFAVSFLIYFGVLCLILYIPARVVLLFEAFYLLRELPPKVLAEVEWNDFIPHL